MKFVFLPESPCTICCCVVWNLEATAARAAVRRPNYHLQIVHVKKLWVKVWNMSSVVAKTAAAQCGAGVQQEQKLTVASSSSSKSNGSSSQNNAAASKTPQLRPRLVQQTRSISSNPLLDGNRSCRPLIPKSRIVKAAHSSHALISKRNQYGATTSTTGSSSFASKGA